MVRFRFIQLQSLWKVGLKMNDIPMFYPKGSTDSERLAEVIAYLSMLPSEIDRAMNSIDASNFTPSFAEKINKILNGDK